MTEKTNPRLGDAVQIHRYGVDVFGTIAEKLSTLGNFTAMVKELVQNADDEKSKYIRSYLINTPHDKMNLKI